MRYLFFFTVFVMLAVTAMGAERAEQEYCYAQKGYFGTMRVSYVVFEPLSESYKGASVDIINGYTCNRWFSIGGGVGLLYYNSPHNGTGKLFGYLHMRANIIDRKVTPFFALNIGGGYCQGWMLTSEGGEIEQQTNGEYNLFFIEPQAGLAVYLTKGKMIDIGVSLFVDDGVDLGLKFSVGFTW